MFKTLFLSAALLSAATLSHAADLAVAPAQPIAPVITAYDWTGFYVGAQAGWGHSSGDVRDTNGGVKPGPFNYDGNGYVVGAFAGYRIEPLSVPVVFGAEVSLGYMDTGASGTIASSTKGQHQNLDLDGGVYTDALAQIGYAIELPNGYGSLLPYVEGGWGYFGGHASQQSTKAGYVARETGSFNGPVLGGGLDWAITQNWIVGLSYKHMWGGTQSASQVSTIEAPVGYVYRQKHQQDFDQVMLRVAYKF